MREFGFSDSLLAWYDAHAREMPWRIGPAQRAAGKLPDPYRVWLSEIMLQQTTVATVGEYFQKFTARWPTVQALADAKTDDIMGEWAGLGYYARARNLAKCARVVAHDHNRQFPRTYGELLKLPGIGPYTAGAICAIAFDQPETVVDGNIERVLSRVFLIETPLPASKPQISAQAAALTPAIRPGDYVQALMDLGATLCTPKSPNCSPCPLARVCQARTTGIQSQLPRKLTRQPKPTRHGVAYLARRTDGALLLERRPETGLLGGMLGWPGSDWSEQPRPTPPAMASWNDPGVQVRHTFTHFHLILTLRTAIVPAECQPHTGQFLPKHRFRRSELPTVMRKAYDLASATPEWN